MELDGKTAIVTGGGQGLGRGIALVTTEGFRDILVIGREKRYSLYDLQIEKPEPLVDRSMTFEVPERVLADGSVIPRRFASVAFMVVLPLVLRGPIPQETERLTSPERLTVPPVSSVVVSGSSWYLLLRCRQPLCQGREPPLQASRLSPSNFPAVLWVIHSGAGSTFDI
jgi:hypothetical protein